ncbi:MAG: hypothetical protein AB7F22_18875 [Reyranella sp.]|uniref:hypothetical protein n=1 Tax=Reyranella sp. TaxID=1929291 RepID=UPI003D10ACF4
MPGTNGDGAGIAWPAFSGSSASRGGSAAGAYQMQAIYFRREEFKSEAECLTAAYRQLLPLEVCR